MSVRLSTILAECRDAGLVIDGIDGDAALNDPAIERIAAVQTCGSGDLVFADSVVLFETALERKPVVIIASRKLKARAENAVDTLVLFTPTVSLAHAFIKQRHGNRDFTRAGWEGPIHPSAVVHETALLDPSVVVEPKAVIGRGAKIGARSRIMAGAVIEHDAKIGADTVVHPASVIGYGCRIGNDCVIGPGSIIGAEGFGFAQDSKGRSYPIPQTGIVVLEDRVRLGASNCIDRATYGETRIGAGTKFDNLCHVAHNVQIGEDCLLTAMFCVAGSSKIGNRVMASGQTGIIDHITICDGAVLVHRAGVVKDIDSPGAYAGLPTQPLDEYLKNTAAFRKGAELRKRVAALESTKETVPPAVSHTDGQPTAGAGSTPTA